MRPDPGSSSRSRSPRKSEPNSAAVSVRAGSPLRSRDLSLSTDIVGSSGERGEARGAGGGPWHRSEPGGEAVEIDRGRGCHVLQAGPGQSTIATAAEPEGPAPLA